eukprot:TRINITY_DN4075_c0_g2_i8.p1 TRINITY_DN4075_c0_g2~~TRINITY_DN4075_c0_g2_i8.p1  ORF type:complete len:337 (-),score=35.43 TRINITY_DN4075_c0_g2_i8:5-1015(-)
MEYADGGDFYGRIREHIKRYSHFHEDHIWKIFIQTVRGLRALHNHKILHRDLKSANVFLMADGRAKLGDLNVSKVAKRGLLYTQTGTPYYASPEVWRDLPYDAKSDIWSLGCVMYEATALKPPFRAQSMEALNQRVQRGIVPRIPMQYSEDMWSMIKALLQVNPKLRPSCDDILKMSVVKKKTQELQLDEGVQSRSLTGNELLGTIQIPKNLRVLREKLPKPHYYSSITNDSESDLPSLPNARCGLKQSISSNAIKPLILPSSNYNSNRNLQPLSSRLPSKHDVPVSSYDSYKNQGNQLPNICLLYTSDAADDMQCVDLGGRRIIKKKKNKKNINT